MAADAGDQFTVKRRRSHEMFIHHGQPTGLHITDLDTDPYLFQ